MFWSRTGEAGSWQQDGYLVQVRLGEEFTESGCTKCVILCLVTIRPFKMSSSDVRKNSTVHHSMAFIIVRGYCLHILV